MNGNRVWWMCALLGVWMVLVWVKLTKLQNIESLTRDHNIDIDPLHSQPTLTPDRKLLRIGDKAAISSDLEICSNLTVTHIWQKFPEANAADAAVTQALCIGMVNFFNSGVGGGGYVVFADKLHPDDNLFIDFRERAPMAATPRMFDHCPECSKVGGLAVAVPGELMGLYHLYQQRGSGHVGWYDLIKPVADLGIRGWAVGEVLAAVLQIYEPFFLDHAKEWSFVLNSTCTGVKSQGDWISRPNFAHMLMELANNGSALPFYDSSNWIVQSMVDTVQKHNGILTLDDFESYHVNESKPLELKIRQGWQNVPNNDLTVLTSSGSSSGAALLSALSIMDRFPSVDGGDYSQEAVFQLVESMKWMASARSRLGDYVQKELPDRIKYVLSCNWTEAAVQSIVNNSKNGDYKTLSNWTEYKPEYSINEPHGTAHFSIVDRFGNAVSLTTTINLLFGSLVYDPKTGVIFNNEMDDFAQGKRSNTFGLAASIYNFPEPGKRPLSSAAPTVVLNELGIPDLIVGASGGSRITTAILQTIVRTYWYKMPILEAIAYPRIHHQLFPYRLEVENFSMVGKETVANLRTMGHVVVQQAPKSVVNAIRYYGATWQAVSDFWRKRGISTVM